MFEPVFHNVFPSQPISRHAQSPIDTQLSLGHAILVQPAPVYTYECIYQKNQYEIPELKTFRCYPGNFSHILNGPYLLGTPAALGNQLISILKAICR